MELNKIRLVEMELHATCNRKCKFCPNSYINRKDNIQTMTDTIFNKVIDELVKAEYTGYISFSRYNEPFIYPKTLRRRVDYIKEKLPDVTLVTNTNGDYDNTAFRDDIEITEMDYDHNKTSYISKDKRYRVMTLKDINNRGGALDLKGEPRTAPCMEPTYFIGIDYEGSIVPCCNFRHDVESQKKYILGNVKDNTLYEIINSKKATDFRQYATKGIFMPACRFCNKKEGRYTRDCPGIA